MRMLKSGILLFGCFLILGQNDLLFGQLGRASITGIVGDTTGAVIPGVTVKAVNVDTQVSYETVSNEVGNYLIGGLPIGQYSVVYSTSGFKEFTRSGLVLNSGQVARVDVSLEVGNVTENITVTGEAPLLQTETAETARSVDAALYRDLALSFATGRNMGEFASKLVAGVSPRSDWGMQINATPQATTTVVIDGMNQLTGFIPGDFAEASISPEAIQEMTVNTGNVSAEFGRAGGGVINMALKSGTNRVHGSGFFYLRNETLNANDWNNNLRVARDPNFTNPATSTFKRPVDRRFDGGGSFGGPVYIPKVYDGRDKTFFHATLEKFHLLVSGPTSLNRSAPQPEMHNGDLSRLLTGRQVGADLLGRPVIEGQIYDPATLRDINGQFVADPFPNNQIPSARISNTARTFQPIFNEFYQPFTTALTNNMFGSRYRIQDITQGTVKLDHNFSDKHKASGFYYWHRFPREYASVARLFSLKDPTGGGPLAAFDAQERRGYSWNASHDWLMSPSLVNHASFGVNYTEQNFWSANSLGRGDHIAWGIEGVGGGEPVERITAPRFNMGSSPVATFEPWGYGLASFSRYISYMLNNTISWQHRSHSLKFGMEWNRQRNNDVSFPNTGGVFNFAARTTGIPGHSYTAQTGNSFASYLLGLVDSAQMGIPFEPISNRDYAAVFVQDAWKVTPRLTLNLGLRWSGNSTIRENNDRFANFNPALPDPNANGLLGAVEYFGEGPGRNGLRGPGSGSWMDLGPSFGLAYRVSNRVVMRGGYGITYTPDTAGGQIVPGGFYGGLIETSQVPSDSQGIYKPVLNIDNGYTDLRTPPTADPSWAQNNNSVRIFPEYTKPGYVQHFNFGFQTELSQSLMVEIDWRFSKGTRYHAGAGERLNQIRPEELARGAVLGQVINSAERAAQAGLNYPYPGWVGTGANTLNPFPQIRNRNLTAFGDTIGFSNYHSGNLSITKRMSKGLHAYGVYTFSKTFSTSPNVRNGGGYAAFQDTYNRTAYKHASGNPHVIKASLGYEIPVGKGRALLSNTGGLLNALVGGWSATAILNYSSGSPLGFPNSRRQPVGWNGPTVWADFNTPAGGFKKMFDPDNFNPWDANDPGNKFFDGTAFSDAQPQQLGTSPASFPQMLGLWRFNEDISLLKNFFVKEGMRVQLRLELLNAFNRHYFSGPDMNMNNSYFGNVRTASGFRTGQAGLRIDW